MLHAVTHPLVVQAMDNGGTTPTEKALLVALEAVTDFGLAQAAQAGITQPDNNQPGSRSTSNS